jgi:hypothetical protein
MVEMGGDLRLQLAIIMIGEYYWVIINIQIYTLTPTINSRLSTKYHKGQLKSNMNKKSENTKINMFACDGNGYIDRHKVHGGQDRLLTVKIAS